MANPVGRPRIVLTDKELVNLEQLAGYGLTLHQIGAVIGVSKRRLEQKNNKDEISAALARGRAKAQGLVGKSLFEKACAGDVGAIRWWEMTRAGRTEKARLDATLSGSDGGPVQYQITRTVIDPHKKTRKKAPKKR